jgi:hypothetical protein
MWTKAEDDALLNLQAEYENQWSLIAVIMNTTRHPNCLRNNFLVPMRKNHMPNIEDFELPAFDWATDWYEQ